MKDEWRMNEEWMKDEWRMNEEWMKDEWRMNEEWWRMTNEQLTIKDDDFKLLMGFGYRQTNGHLWM